jgi:GT2 family glycosyltransferase
VTQAAGLAVAVATSDRPEELGRCLDALLAGERAPAEVIVVDQGASVAAEQAVRARNAAGVPLVYVRQEGLGLSRSRNEGFRRAAAPAVAFTDDDCVPGPGWVAALERALADGADAVTGPMLPLGPDEPGLHAVASRTSLVRRTFSGDVAPWAVGTGANLALRRELLDRVGGYDERLGTGSAGRAGEDLDLIHRLLRGGAAIRYEPEALVYHARQPADRRRRTRSSYGWGVGACCSVWLRQRDFSAPAVLARWLFMRGALLGRAVARGRWSAAHDELLVLAGTAGGLLYGLRAPRQVSSTG